MKVSCMVADVLKSVAVKSTGKASCWYSYQPKEPQKLKELSKMLKAKN